MEKYYVCFSTSWISRIFLNIFSFNSAYRGHNHHMPSAFATFPLTTMTVEESVHYQTLGFALDNVWLSATSSSYGYLRLGPESRLFDTTTSHELHCLSVFNLAFTKVWSLETGHIHHCLSYLRQSILCDCNLTLERRVQEQILALRSCEVLASMPSENFDPLLAVAYRDPIRTPPLLWVL